MGFSHALPQGGVAQRSPILEVPLRTPFVTKLPNLTQFHMGMGVYLGVRHDSRHNINWIIIITTTIIAMHDHHQQQQQGSSKMTLTSLYRSNVCRNVITAGRTSRRITVTTVDATTDI